MDRASLFTISSGAKSKTFIRRVRAILPPDGLFLIWETTCLEGEDREDGWSGFDRCAPQWPVVTDDEFAAFDSHHRASDYPETATTWMEYGDATSDSAALMNF